MPPPQAVAALTPAAARAEDSLRLPRQPPHRAQELAVDRSSDWTLCSSVARPSLPLPPASMMPARRPRRALPQAEAPRPVPALARDQVEQPGAPVRSFLRPPLAWASPAEPACSRVVGASAPAEPARSRVALRAAPARAEPARSRVALPAARAEPPRRRRLQAAECPVRRLR